MKQYIGTKVINAISMNRLDYNKLRGWELPSDENGEDEGFLVEYIDGGQANHVDFKGYISWSPKEVFEKSYKVSETYKDRISIELVELNDRLDKLKSFVCSEKFDALSNEDQHLLRTQLSAMSIYSDILIYRYQK